MGDGFLANMSPDTQGLLKLMGGIMPRVALGGNAPQQIAAGGGFRPGGILSAIAEYASGKQQRQAQQQMGQLTQRAYGPTGERIKGTEGIDLSRVSQFKDLMDKLPGLLERVTPHPAISTSRLQGYTPAQTEQAAGRTQLPPQVSPEAAIYGMDYAPAPQLPPLPSPLMTDKDIAKFRAENIFTPLLEQEKALQKGPMTTQEKTMGLTEKARGLEEARQTTAYQESILPGWGGVRGPAQIYALNRADEKRQVSELMPTLGSLMGEINDPLLRQLYQSSAQTGSYQGLKIVQNVLQNKNYLSSKFPQAAKILLAYDRRELNATQAIAEAANQGVPMDLITAAVNAAENRKQREATMADTQYWRDYNAAQKEEQFKINNERKDVAATEKKMESLSRQILAYQKVIAADEEMLGLPNQKGYEKRLQQYGPRIAQNRELMLQNLEEWTKLKTGEAPPEKNIYAAEIPNHVVLEGNGNVNDLITSNAYLQNMSKIYSLPRSTIIQMLRDYGKQSIFSLSPLY